MLERIASAEKPSMDLKAIKAMREDLEREDDAGVDDLVKTMEPVLSRFRRGKGDLQLWTPKVLAAIDKCFVDIYMVDDEPSPNLFSVRGSTENNIEALDAFREYYDTVDDILVKHKSTVPPYAREYFALYSMSAMHNFSFPVPLVTASVVECLNKILSGSRKGLIEVSTSNLNGGHPGSCPHKTRFMRGALAAGASPEYVNTDAARLTAPNIQIIGWLATLVSWSLKINARVSVVWDMFDSMVTAVSADPIIRPTPLLGFNVSGLPFVMIYPPIPPTNPHATQLYRLIFSVLRPTVAIITVYLNKSDTLRDLDVKLKDLDMVVRLYRAEIDGKTIKTPKGRSKGKGKGKKKAGEDDSDEEDEEAMRLNNARDVIETVGSNEDEFVQLSQEICKRMLKPFGREERGSDDPVLRILATCGLTWNAKSRAKDRDFSQIALAAILESRIVPTYRRALLNACPSSRALRGAIADYLSERAKAGKRVPGRPKWFYADLIEYSTSHAEMEMYNPEELQKELDKSIRVAKMRKSNAIKGSVDTLLKNKYLACSEKGVKPGTLETSVYYLILLFIKVSGIYSNLEFGLGLKFAHAITDRL